MATIRAMMLLAIVPLIVLVSGAWAENVVLVIVDGARYTETFGDPSRTHIPEMDDLASQGTIVDEFYNDQYTYTSRAVPALWCGDWTEVRDTTYEGHNTQYTLSPSIFEYFRHDTGAPANQCFYVLKYLTSLWLPSFHPEYGQDYWPTFHSEGLTDTDVLDNALFVMETYHPQFMLVYFADVDHAGHSGVWEDYLNAIETADSCVGALWSAIQADDFYQDNTTMMVTNDHGRHDDNHGGFSGHGDGCDGCRHIMMLAVGPEIQQDVVTTTYRTIPDFAVTACEILESNPAYASGDVMNEIFVVDEVGEESATMPDEAEFCNVYPNPFNGGTTVSVNLDQPGRLTVEVFNLTGQRVLTVMNGYVEAGEHRFSVVAEHMPTGSYYLRTQMEDQKTVVQKMTLIR